MAHSKQAWTRNRQSEEKRVVTKNVRTRMKSSVKRALAAPAAEHPKVLADAMKRIDKAAKTHAIHKNAAARHTSRLAKALNKAKAAKAAAS